MDQESLFVCKKLNELKYEYLIKKSKNAGIKHYNNPNTFTKRSNAMDDVYENIDDYNLSRKRKRKKLIVFDDMIADIMTNKRFQTTIKYFLLGAEN